jgi:hypothetical protein
MFRPLTVCVLSVVACAHRAAPPTADRTVRLRPLTLRVAPEERGLAGLQGEELLASGRDAMGRGDERTALAAFTRLARSDDDAPLLRAHAAFEAGRLSARIGRHAEARALFAQAAGLFGEETPEGLDARFRLADAAYFDGDRLGAAAVLRLLASTASLTEARRLEASVKAAVCLADEDRLDEAEGLLRDAIARIAELPPDLRRDADLEGRARFQLGELLRRRFEAAPVTPEDGRHEPLVAQLEAKCRLLLEAQELYLRCIRIGHPEWATAAGYRIGALYGALHAQLVAARPPAGLTAEEDAAYRSELAARLSVLVDKAAATWEKTLATAERVGATNALVEQARADLARLRTSAAELESP